MFTHVHVRPDSQEPRALRDGKGKRKGRGCKEENQAGDDSKEKGNGKSGGKGKGKGGTPAEVAQSEASALLTKINAKSVQLLGMMERLSRNRWLSLFTNKR